jgi:hypothetical protein
MTFATTIPPKYDCEIFNEITNKASLIGIQEDLDSSLNNLVEKYLVFVRLKL